MNKLLLIKVALKKKKKYVHTFYINSDYLAITSVILFYLGFLEHT